MIQTRLGMLQDPLSIERAKRAAYYIKNKYDEISVELVLVDQKRTNLKESREIALLDAMTHGETDVAVVDASLLNTSEFRQACRNKGIAIAALLKRADPRYVLITEKHHKRIELTEHSEQNVIQVTDELTRSLVLNLYDAIDVMVEPKATVQDLMERIKDGESDGAVVLADTIKLLKLAHDRTLSYDYIDCEKMVPEQGRAILCLLTKTDGSEEIFTALNHISFTKSEKEMLIEREVKRRVNQKPHLEFVHFCVSALIEREHLIIYADIALKERSFRFHEKGNYEDRMHLIRKLSAKILKIVEY